MTTYNVSSGQTSTGITLNNGDAEYVLSGGFAIATAVNSGGQQTVFSGGRASNTTVGAGGAEYLSGGITVYTTVNSGGFESIYNLGSALNTTVNADGGLSVLSGGVASNATVTGAAAFVFISSGSVDGTTLSAGGTQFVDAGGLARATTVDSGGREVLSGAIAIGAKVNSGGDQVVLVGGIASSTTVFSSGRMDVSSGGAAVSAVASSGGGVYVSAGGTATATTVSNGGLAQVTSGATATGTTVDSGGLVNDYAGGSMVSTTVSSGGSATLYGGTASFTTVSRGILYVESGGTATNTTLSGGEEFVYGTATSTTVSGGRIDLYGTDSATVLDNGGFEYLSTGAVAISTTVNSGGTQSGHFGTTQSATTVNSGGVAYFGGSAVSATLSGGSATVYGVARDTTVSSGGVLGVYAGGTATSATVSSGGHLIVSGGGNDANTTVDSGGVESVLGGSAIGTQVSAGGDQSVYSGGTAAGTHLVSGQQFLYSGVASVAYLTDSSVEYVESPSSAVSVTVANRSEQFVSGGLAIDSFVMSGGTMKLYAGGVASGATVVAGGSALVSASGTASGTTVSSGGFLTVSSGGTASGTTVSSFGVLSVTSGATAVSTTVNSGGSAWVALGTTTGTTVNSGGSASVFSGTMSATTLSSGGVQYVSAGGSAVDTTVSSGGYEYVSSGGTAISTTVESGGLEYISSGGSVGATTLNGGTLDVIGDVASGATIAFAGTAAATLELAQTSQMGGSVTGFATGDTIDLTGIAPSSVSFASGTLSVAGGQSFALSTTGPGETVQVASNGSGGTALTVVSATGPIVATGGTVTYTGGGTAVALDSGATVTDGNPVTGAAVWINSGFVSGDQIHFTNQSGITGSFNAATGTLTLSGSASAANWQTALDSITFSFSPSDGDPTQAGNHPSRTIDWQASDTGGSSPVTSSTVITQLASILSYGATIDEGGIVAASETVDTGGTLTLFNSGGTAVGSIDVGTSLSTGFFTLTSDGAGGTDVIVDTVFGTYTSGITLLTNPTTIAAAGRATNTVASGVAVSNPFGSNGTLTNDGLIAETASSGIGVSLGTGGVVTNASGGTISGDTGVYSGGNPATLINAGALSGNSVSGRAVNFRDGGVVSNQSGGSITGLSGIYIGNASGTVSNSGAITGIVGTRSSYGIMLSDGGFISNASGGTISGVWAIVANSGTTTVVNAGSIGGISESGSYDSRGVYLFAGGSVTNETGGVISGFNAVRARVASVTVVNVGTISGGATGASRGVALLAGDSLTNQSGGTITGENAVYVAFAGTNAVAAAVTNAGVIGDTTGRSGVYMRHQGVVTNQAGGVIRGAWFGVDLRQGGTLLNAGSIAGGVSAFSAGSGYATRVIIDPGAVFTGTVDGGNSIGATSVSTLELASGASTGTISGLGTQFVNFASIVIDSYASWSITGTNSIASGETMAIDYRGSPSVAGTLVNTGLIANASVGGLGVVSGGLISNQSGGTISGSAAGFAVQAISAGTIINAGLISNANTGYGKGIYLVAGGSVTNLAGGTISGDIAVYGKNGGAITVVNAGAILETGTLNNGDGIVTNAAGSVSNQSGGTISGYNGIFFSGSGATLTNAGQITGQAGGEGVRFGVNGVLTNQAGGTISGGLGVLNAASVVNAGLLQGVGTTLGSGLGVSLHSAGSLTNQSGGTITGAVDGVLAVGGTVVNQAGGVISGGDYAVFFSSGYTNRLVVYNGASFNGTVDGGNAIGASSVSTLELASGSGVGTINGIGSSFVHFGAIVFDAGARWDIAGGDGAAALGGATISGFSYGDTIDLTNFAAVSRTFSSDALVLTNSVGSHATLHLPGTFTTGNIAISSDGSSGTDIQLQTGAEVLNYGTAIDEGGIVASTETVDAGGTLTLFNSGGTAVGTINVGTTLSTGDFVLQPDGSGGTNVVLDTVFGTYTSGVTLLTNPTTIAATAAVSGTASTGAAVYGAAGTTWTVVNDGQLSETGTAGSGISLNGVGTVSNQSGGVISGASGVSLSIGTVTNAGAIDSSSASTLDAGIAFVGTGTVSNQSSGLITGHYGILGIGAPLTVTNAGTIQGSATSGSATGIVLDAGGTVSNSGTITGGAGIVVSGTSVAAVTDSGAIIGTDGTAVALGSGNDTVQFQPSSSAFIQGTVDGGGGTNTLAFLSGGSAGTLTGSNADFVNFTSGPVASGATWVLAGSETFGSGITLTNSGSLSATGTLSNAGTINGNPLTLNGASFTNQAGGLVSGAAYGVVASSASTLVNDGSLAANTVSGEAVSFADGGVVSNQSAGSITGNTGVLLNGTPGTVFNSGAIAGIPNSIGSYGVFLSHGGVVSNASSGTISGVNGAVGAAGAATVINAGSLGTSTSVVNSNGVYLRAAGVLTNQAGGVISAYRGVNVKGTVVTLVNAGAIGGSTTGFGYGVVLGAGGSITNQAGGTITGENALAFNPLAPGAVVTITNAGSIGGGTTGIGVYLSGAGTLTNLSGGVISGGTDAVKLRSGSTNRLVIDPGAVFSGTVDGGNAIGATSISTLELASGASAGTLNGVGNQYIDFAQITLDAGAQWDIVSSYAGAALGGATVSGFAYGDTIDLTNFAAVSRTFSSDALVLTNSAGSHATLHLPGTFTTGNIAITSDGSSGTDIQLQTGAEVLNYGATIDEGGIVASTETVDAGGTLTLFNSGGTAVGTINVGTTLSTGDFVLKSDGSGGTNVVLDTVFGSYTSGVTLLTNPTTIAATAAVSATVSGGAAVYGGSGTNWTVVNDGQVTDTGTNGSGIHLAGNGTISNQSGGTISGAFGVKIGGAGNVVNAGLITGTQTSNFVAGVDLHSGGSLTNQSGGAISGAYGVEALYGGTVVNAGTIKGIGAAGGEGGVFVNHGGTLSNESGGLITGRYGILANIGALTVTNAGSVGGGAFGVRLEGGGSVGNQSGGVIGGSTGVELDAGGSVNNAGTITSGEGIAVYGSSAVSVIDSGSIIGTGGTAIGLGRGNDLLQLQASASAFIQGAVDGGGGTNTLEFLAGTGTLTGSNASFNHFTQGTVDSGASWVLAGSNTFGAGVSLLVSGTLTDTGTLSNAGTLNGEVTLSGALFTNQAGGLVQNAYLYGVSVASANSVANAGTISATSGYAIYFQGNGNVSNAAGGLITGLTGVRLAGSNASVVNLGSIDASQAFPHSYAVYLRDGGSVTNGQSGATSAAISGYYGIGIHGAVGTVTNAGTVAATATSAAAVQLANGGAVTNGSATLSTALLQGGTAGVYASGGSVINYATIQATNTSGASVGVLIEAGGTLNNLGSAALVEGYFYGAKLTGGGTVTNAGTIASSQGASGDAVAFGSGSSRLIIDPGATFIGSVLGGSGTSIMELASAASAGTIAGLGSSVTNFDTLVFDAGAQWTVAGNDSASGLGTLAISGFGFGDTIDVTNFSAVSRTFSSNALVLTDIGGAHTTLDVLGSFSTGQVQIGSDGGTGTDIWLQNLPSIGAGGSATFTGGGAAVVLDGSISLSDAASTTLVSATVAINSGSISGDMLNYASLTGLGIVGNYDTATGTLTLSGTASIQNYQSALDSITYSFSPSNGDPTGGGSDTSRGITWIVNDGSGSSPVAASTVNVVHVAPSITAGGTATFTGGGSAVVLDGSIAVTDVDSGGTLTGATVAINSGSIVGDVLNYTSLAGLGITGSFDSSTGTLTLRGASSIQNYESALDSITYGFTAGGDPTSNGGDASRGISWQVNDGVANSNAGTSTLDIVHVAPTITAGATASFNGGGLPVVLDGSIAIADVDSGGTLSGATVAINVGSIAGDVLNYASLSGLGIVGSYDSATGTLTLSGTASVANYQTALDSITYSFSPGNGDPTGGGSDTSRSITWSVTDGNTSNGISNTGSSTVTTVHTAPTITAGGTATFTGGGSAVALDGSLAVSDVDSGGVLTGATVVVGSGFLSGDVLNFVNQNGITGSYNSATGTLTLSGTASVATYQTALDSITYSFSPGNGDPTGGGSDTSRSITWSVTDGNTGNGISNTGSSTVTTVHTAPTITAGGTATFTGGGSAVVLDGSIAVTDVDSGGTLAGATVAINSGSITGDVLNYTSLTGLGITGSFDSTTGTLTLTGASSIANYQSALDSVTYSFSPGNGDPTGGGSHTARGITWSVNDGVAISNTASSTLTDVHVGPSISASGTVGFAAGGGAAALDAGIVVSDPDSGGVLTGATVSVASGFLSGDVLNYASLSGLGITSSYNAATGVLTLSGTSSVANYQSALASITYSFTPGGGDPSNGGTDSARTIDWLVNDGVAASNTGVSSLTVSGPSPVLAGTSGAIADFVQQGAAVVLDSGLTLSDSDSTTLSSATVAITGGFLPGDTLMAATAGTAISAIYSNGTLTLSVTDTLAHYQQVLRGITYSSTATDPTGGGSDFARTVTWQINDGRGANNLSNIGTTTIDAHVRPVVTAGTTVTFATGGAAVQAEPGLGVTDADTNPIITGTVTIGTGLLSGDVLAFNNGTDTESFGDGATIAASFNATTGALTFTETGSQASAADWQSALQSVTFDNTGTNPTGSGADPTRTLTWTLNTANPDQTSVAVTSTIDLLPAPVISGTLSGQATTDEAAIDPFSGVSITDPNAGQTETVTITESDAANGTLSNLGGGTFNNGTYVVTGSAAQVTQAIDGLVFTPTAHQVAPGNTVTTGFTIAVIDSAGAAGSNSTTSIVATAVNDSPTITQVTDRTGVPNENPASPFGVLVVSDADVGHVDTLTVTLSDPAGGTLSNLSGGSFDAATGIYTLTGSAAALTAALAALVFTPAQPAAGSFTATTGFTVRVTGPGGSASDDTISVTAVTQQVPGIHGSASSSTISISPDGSSFAPATAGQTNEAVISNPSENGSYALPDGYQAAFLGGSADATLTDTSVGGAVLVGNSGNDTLTTGANHDTLVGGTGDNTFRASGTGDVIGVTGVGAVDMSGSQDKVFAGAGALTLHDSGIGDAIGLSSGPANVTLSGRGASVFANTGSLSLVDNGTGDKIGGGSGPISATLGGSGSSVYGGSGSLSLDVASTASAVVIGTGQSDATLTLSGSSTTVYGGSGNLSADVTGNNAVIGLDGGTAALTLAGSAAQVFGGSGDLSVVDLGHGDTIGASSGATTVRGGGSGVVVVGGSGNLTFVGGANDATVVGGSGSTTVIGGAGATTLYGSAGGTVTYLDGSGAITYQAGLGNETLQASGTGTGAIINGGIDASGHDLLVGGSGNDSLFAGTGADTLSGGGGSNEFVFYKSVIAGSAPHDFITGFNANDTVYLVGYGSGAAARALNSAATSGGSTTITLSDNTQITFANVGGANMLSGHLVSF